MTNSSGSSRTIGSRITGCFKKIGSMTSKLHTSMNELIDAGILYIISELYISLTAPPQPDQDLVDYLERRQARAERAERAARAAKASQDGQGFKETEEALNKPSSQEKEESCDDEELDDENLEAMYSVPAPGKSGTPKLMTEEEIEAAIQATGEMRTAVLNEAMSYIASITSIIEYSKEMRDVVYAPMMILLFMKGTNYPYPEGIEMTEKDFHQTVTSDYKDIWEISDCEIKQTIACGMEPTFSMCYWGSVNEKYNSLYINLFRNTVGAILDPSKAGTRTETNIVFYGEIMKYVRNTVAEILGKLTEHLDLVTRNLPKTYHGFKERLLETLTTPQNQKTTEPCRQAVVSSDPQAEQQADNTESISKPTSDEAKDLVKSESVESISDEAKAELFCEPVEQIDHLAVESVSETAVVSSDRPDKPVSNSIVSQVSATIRNRTRLEDGSPSVIVDEVLDVNNIIDYFTQLSAPAPAIAITRRSSPAKTQSTNSPSTSTSIVSNEESLITELRRNELYRRQRLISKQEEQKEVRERMKRTLEESGQSTADIPAHIQEDLTMDDLSDESQKPVNAAVIQSIQNQHSLTININSHIQMLPFN